MATDYNVLSKSFISKFIDSDNLVFNSFSAYITDCITKWKSTDSTKIIAPIAIICQSSGYGKSKSLFHFAESHLTTFICLRGEQEDGFPLRSPIAGKMISCLKESLAATKRFLMVFMKRTLEVMIEITASRKKMSQQKMAKIFMEYQPWTYPENKQQWSEKQKKFSDSISNQDECELNQLTRDVTILKAKLGDQLSDIIIAIDEAQHLAMIQCENESHPKSLFRRLRKAIIELFKGWNIAFVLTTTNTSISAFNYGRSQIDASARNTNKTIYPPFGELVYCDQMCPAAYFDNVMQSYRNKTLFEFITKRDPVKEIFYMGRPLWGAYHDAITKMDLKKVEEEKGEKAEEEAHIIRLAKAKLILANDWKSAKDKQCASFAVLCASTSLLSLVSIVKQELWAEMVARYMATLAYVDDKCDVMFLTYVSEPILAEAACYYMANKVILNELLTNLHQQLTTTAVQSLGHLGEFVAEVILLSAKNDAASELNKQYKLDHRRFESTFSMYVTVENFLVALVGQNGFFLLSKKFKNLENDPYEFKKTTQEKSSLKKSLPFNKEFLKGIIAFSHFLHQEDDITPDGFVMNLLGRCAAARLKNNSYYYDLIIPVVVGKELGAIAIQVKNVVHTTSDKKAISQMTPENLEKLTNITFSNTNVLSIYMNVGSSSPQLDVDQNGTIIISGLSPTLYPCLSSTNNDVDICGKFSNILNCSRTNIWKLKDIKPEVKKRILYGKVNSYESMSQ